MRPTVTIFLNLHTATSSQGRKHRCAIDGLIDLNTGEVITKTTTTGTLFPVEFGARHQGQRFIELTKTMGSPRAAKPETAKLVKRGDDYEIHVSFSHEAFKITPRPAYFLGVYRGINNLCSLSMIDPLGVVLAEKNIDGRGLRHIQRLHELRQRNAQQKARRYRSKTRLAESDKAVHTAANAIVAMAVEYQARVVMEWLGNLTDRSKKRGRSNFNRMINRQQFAKLQKVLEYKLAAAGFATISNSSKSKRIKEVPAGYTSMTCPECGHCDKVNRDRNDPDNRFICQSCGYQHDADLNAARVIALKKNWLESLPQSQQKKKVVDLEKNRTVFKSF